MKAISDYPTQPIIAVPKGGQALRKRPIRASKRSYIDGYKVRLVCFVFLLIILLATTAAMVGYVSYVTAPCESAHQTVYVDTSTGQVSSVTECSK